MLASVKRIVVEENRRMIAVSDIHGNLPGLKKLLNKVSFSKDDYLFIVGDMIEKGPQSLNTLRFIMELCKTHNVFPVKGNCDSVAVEIYHDKVHKELLNYMLRRKKCLLNEMCETLSIKVSRKSDMKKIKEALSQNFSEELNWIASLPDIIDTQKFTFVHAGLTSKELDKQKAEKVQSTDAFLNQGVYLDKYCIVGHWPVVLYSEAIPDCNPIIDKKHKIISIDGGNVVKRNGQLNAFIIPHIHSEEFSYLSFDDIRKGIIISLKEGNNNFWKSPISKENQIPDLQEKQNSMLIHWIDNKINVLEKEEEFSYCEHNSTKYRMWILNKYIYKEKDGYYCEDSTDYQLPVKTGEMVSVIEITKKGYLIKQNGITGWVCGNIKLL
ncbi:metallophosphoesterase [Anaerocolumna sedimenticola]|uniref:Metallophosphoesterase n=1 Tax=Anaerocolumna sedimenticola TaxID=2696063 RepID=A0A6P1TLM8_9FIRM|nr:metallophosphoesterase [Anaerocolumna sedimenticola]QHQ61323.1 metallophosphoesterase [Anaerocolumna sedimenticola]